MKQYFQHYYHSFNLDSRFWKMVVIDGIALLALFLLFSGFGSQLETQSKAISGGRSIEELKVEILTSVETAEQFSSQLRNFLWLFLLGGLLVCVLALMIYSYSRQLVWKELLQQGTYKVEWKWNGLILILLILAILYLLIYGAVRFMAISLVTFQIETTAVIFSQSLNAWFFLLFLIFAVVVKYSFAREGKVWLAIGNAFHLLKINYREFGFKFLMIVITGIIISFIFYALHKSLYLRFSDGVFSIAQLAVFVIFLGWMRRYLVKE